MAQSDKKASEIIYFNAICKIVPFQTKNNIIEVQKESFGDLIYYNKYNTCYTEKMGESIESKNDGLYQSTTDRIYPTTGHA